VVSPDTLAAKRRHAIVGIVAFVAVITPGGDPVSLIAMTIPLCIFYEASIWLARLMLAVRQEPRGDGHGRVTVSPSDSVPFTLDRFQLEAIAEFDAGRSVLVAAPTGSGKTVVADAAIDIALNAGGKTFYTTPIKALSNQKFSDLVARLGTERVGLLTGDTAVNGDAPVVVMTTEVLRNMLYVGVGRRSTAARGRARRGPLPAGFVPGPGLGGGHHRPPANGPARLPVGDGVERRRVGRLDRDGARADLDRASSTSVLSSSEPVPRGDRSSDRDHLMPILVDGRPNPEGHRFDGDPGWTRRRRGAVPGSRFGSSPRRVETIERLARRTCSRPSTSSSAATDATTRRGRPRRGCG
jgi:hypothetical protein